jgi:GNAT superfamily N-acetyltransferase
MRATSPDYYSWKLAANPQGQGEIVLVLCDGQVIGSLTLTPRLMRYRGRLVNGAELGDAFTHVDYRRRGVYSRSIEECERIAQERGFEVVFGCPNEESLAAQVKLQFALARSADVRVMQKVRGTDYLKERAKARLSSDVLANAATALVRLDARIRSGILSRGRSASALSDMAFSEVPNDLLEASCATADFSIVKSAAYLDWRYATNPDRYEIHGIEMSGAIRGAIVTKLVRDGSQSILAVMDLIADPLEPGVPDATAWAVEVLSERANADVCRLYAARSSAYFRAFRRAGFRERWGRMRLTKPVTVYAGTSSGESLATGENRWQFSIGDSDNY